VCRHKEVFERSADEHIRYYRRISPSQRLKIALELSDLCADLTRSAKKVRFLRKHNG